MEDKFNRYCELVIAICIVLLLAIMFFTLGSVFGFALSEHFGFNGYLKDFVTFTLGICGLVGLYPAVKFLTWLGKYLG